MNLPNCVTSVYQFYKFHDILAKGKRSFFDSNKIQTNTNTNILLHYLVQTQNNNERKIKYNYNNRNKVNKKYISACIIFCKKD